MEDLKITGEVEDIIYRNKDNGYTVFSLTTEDDGDLRGRCAADSQRRSTGNSRKLGHAPPLRQAGTGAVLRKIHADHYGRDGEISFLWND